MHEEATNNNRSIAAGYVEPRSAAHLRAAAGNTCARARCNVWKRAPRLDGKKRRDFTCVVYFILASRDIVRRGR